MFINEEEYAKLLNGFTEVSIQLKRTQKFLKENISDMERTSATIGDSVCSEVEKYMNLPYNVSIKKIVSDICYYIATVDGFDDCTGSGRTVEEAYEDAMGMLKITIMHNIKNNIPIPIPAQ